MALSLPMKLDAVHVDPVVPPQMSSHETQYTG